MSERNMSGKHISKDKIPVKDIRKNDIPKDGKSRDGREQKAGQEKWGRSGKGGGAMYGLCTVLWMLLCAALLVRIWFLNRTTESLRTRIADLTQMIARQQDRLEELAQMAGPEENGALGRQGSGYGEPQEGAAAVNGQGIAGMGGQGDSPGGPGSAPEEISAAHKVYLTFDDGPSANTEEILEILDRYGVKATFFVVGREGSQAEETMRKIVEAGHTLGMHSYTHDYAEVYESVESFAEDLQREQAYLYEVTGVKSNLYRFPGGSSNAVSQIDMREFAEYLDSQGIRFFDWNISSGDGGSFLVPVEMLIENCTATIGNHGTSVVLMHDAAGKTTTREALPEIIEKIQAMEDTVLLPITDETPTVQHIQWQSGQEDESAAGGGR